jgi:hypothetical protein
VTAVANGFDAAAATAYDEAEADAAAAAAAAVLTPPAFSATCAVLRAMAPSLATLVFLETLRPSFEAMEQYLHDGGGDDNDDAAAATAAAAAAAAAAMDGRSSAGGVAEGVAAWAVNYRSGFFVLAAMCAAMVCCVFAFFGRGC